MRFNRARYVTVCQQFLVTAVVLVVGLSAAGVMTLQIVAPEGGGPAEATGMAPAIRVSDAYVDTAPVTPEVREVKVEGVDRAAAAEIPGAVTKAPQSEQRTAPAEARPKTLAALSAPTAVHGYATVGVTWKAGTKLAEDDISVQVRTRTGDTWSGWTTAAYHDEHGPDPDSAEAGRVRPGTDAVVVGDVDEVQMKAETASGQAPADLELAVVDPGVGELKKEPAAIDTADLAPASARTDVPVEGQGEADPGTDAPGDSVSLTGMRVSPKPTIYSRAQWGANEKLRDKKSLHYGTIKTGFIHHTVNANDYSAAQVPALIRGIYAYHTQSRGWSDIGYNFLVDRFGRIWEGRYGGVDRPVVGAHTLGYNEYSFAMSAIGNFQVAAAPKAVKNAYAALFAWKLSLNGIRADATRLWVKNRYLHAINGHRDVGQTACPGQYLYAKIPKIRIKAQRIQDAAQVPVDPAALPVVPAPVGVPSPTQPPAPAAPQPSMRFPVRSSIVGTGWPDLVAMNSAGQIRITSTEGIAGIDRRVSNPGPWRKMSVVAAVGDVTGDGKGDVLARKASNNVAKVFPGDGAGHLGKGIARTKAFAGYDQIVGAGDFDRDGRNDVVARQAKTTALMLFRGTGRGGFATPIVLKKHWRYSLTTPAGRFGPGKNPDLAAMKPSGALFLFPGLGRERKLGPRVRIATIPRDVTGLALTKLVGDKWPDLVMRRGDGMSSISTGTGTARWGQGYQAYPELAGLTQLSTGQMLGSGAAEIVGRDAGGRLVVVAGNGRRNLGGSYTTNLTVPGTVRVLDVGDWDRNGTADLITVDSGADQLVLRPGLGNGKFGRGRSLGTGWSKVGKLAAVGDVTGDQFPDLVGRVTATDAWTIFPGAGNNGFKPPVLAPAALRTYNQIGPGAWSFGGQLFLSSDRSFVPLAGVGVASALRSANGLSTTSYDFYVGAGDADGDGVADVLAREKGTGVIWLLPGKTSGGFGPRVWVAAGFAGYQLLG